MILIIHQVFSSETNFKGLFLRLYQTLGCSSFWNIWENLFKKWPMSFIAVGQNQNELYKNGMALLKALGWVHEEGQFHFRPQSDSAKRLAPWWQVYLLVMQWWLKWSTQLNTRRTKQYLAWQLFGRLTMLNGIPFAQFVTWLHIISVVSSIEAPYSTSSLGWDVKKYLSASSKDLIYLVRCWEGTRMHWPAREQRCTIGRKMYNLWAHKNL